jgi:hypothetical protein
MSGPHTRTNTRERILDFHDGAVMELTLESARGHGVLGERIYCHARCSTEIARSLI